MRTNKHQAVFNWLMRYEPLNQLFFNFSQAKNNYAALIPVDTDDIIKSYIDGSCERAYVFAVAWYKKFTTAQTDGDKELNISALFDVEKFMDWIDAQNEAGNYPDFGADCSVWEIENLQDMPKTEGEDMSSNLAKYLFSCKIKYLEEKENV